MDSSFEMVIADRAILTTVTANPNTVTNWIRDVDILYQYKSNVVIGLDVEWKPNRYSGQNNPAATLQLFVGKCCLIIQLIHIPYFPQSLNEFLRNPRYLFAGVGIVADVEKLQQDWGLMCENVYDVREVALKNRRNQFSGWPGLKELAEKIAGISLEKPKRVTLSDWGNGILDTDQIHYACLDAYASCWTAVNLYHG